MKPITAKSRAVYSPWVVRTRTVLVRLIAVASLALGVSYGAERAQWLQTGGSHGLGFARNVAVLALFAALVAWAFWTKEPKVTADYDPIVALLGQAPSIRLEALLADDPSEPHEPLVVGTSLTYAQFLKRPRLRDVVQTQALSEPKVPVLGNALDERSFFHEALFEQHLADWNSQSPTRTERESAYRVAGGLGHGNHSNKHGSVDELLERWINDDADAPLPDFLTLADS